MNKTIKILFIILLILIVIIGAAIGIFFLYVNNKVAKINYVEIQENEVDIEEEVKSNLQGYRNIAILGIDSRQDDYGKGNRSDCIIIVSINESTKEVKLLSIYRDTYLELTGMSLDKVTHAYSYGGPTLALSTLNTNLDLNIAEFVTVNFNDVKEIIDSIGGVEINITSEEVSHIQGINSSGTYNLTGEQALAYSRIRYATGGDFKRTERMRDVIIAVANKAKTLNIGQLNSFADTVLSKVYTNIRADQVMSLLPKVLDYKIVDSIGWPYNTKGTYINSIYYGVPVDLEENVKQLHKELFNEDNYEVSDTVKQISDKIKQTTQVQ